MNLQTAYRLDDQTLLVPRRVRIAPGDPEWERWLARAVPLPKSWNGRVRVMLLTHRGQSGRSSVSTSNPEPEAPAPVVVASVAPGGPVGSMPADRLSPAEVAPLVFHSEETVQRWCRAGVLRSGKIGRKVFVLRSEVDRFLRHGPAVKPVKRTWTSRTRLKKR